MVKVSLARFGSFTTGAEITLPSRTIATWPVGQVALFALQSLKVALACVWSFERIDALTTHWPCGIAACALLSASPVKPVGPSW